MGNTEALSASEPTEVEKDKSLNAAEVERKKSLDAYYAKSPWLRLFGAPVSVVTPVPRKHATPSPLPQLDYAMLHELRERHRERQQQIEKSLQELHRHASASAKLPLSKEAKATGLQQILRRVRELSDERNRVDALIMSLDRYCDAAETSEINRLTKAVFDDVHAVMEHYLATNTVDDAEKLVDELDEKQEALQEISGALSGANQPGHAVHWSEVEEYMATLATEQPDVPVPVSRTEQALPRGQPAQATRREKSTSERILDM